MMIASPLRTEPAIPAAHVLIVDDDAKIARSVSELLALGGFQVSLAFGGQDALTKLQASLSAPQTGFDLVLVDIGMPEISGLDVLKWIRRHPQLKYLRVVMLTGVTDKREMVEALTLGADDYITKPASPQELLARTKTLVRSRELERLLQHQRDQLTVLNRVNTRISSRLELAELLEAAVAGAAELLDVTAISVYMHDQKRNALRCQQIWLDGELRQPEPAHALMPVGDGLLSAVFLTRKMVAAPHVSRDGRYRSELDAPPGLIPISLLAAPLFVRGRAVGVLAAYNKRGDGERFTETDIDLFSSFISTTSQAIENAWLFSNVKQRQQELLENRNTLQALIDGILHPIYTINQQWQVVSVNRTRLDASRLSAEQLSNQVCYRVFFQRESPCDHCLAAITMSRQLPQRWSVRWVGPDYLPQEWDLSAYPMPTSQLSVAIVWQDRTEERRLESSLLQASKLSALGQLAAGVAHEINNPLTVISTSAEMLKEALAEDEENQELVDWIAKASGRASHVVRGLLDFARQSRLLFTAGDLNTSILEAVEMVQYQLRSAEIVCQVNLHPEPLEIAASWEHLKTVWLNLLLNARDALAERAEDRHIEVITRLAPSHDHVQVLVRDNGIGMAEEQVAHIFEPFYTTKEPGKGTGLGLATCHRIIDQHGGEISVTSSQGEGATFVIRLPITERPGYAGAASTDAVLSTRIASSPV